MLRQSLLAIGLILCFGLNARAQFYTYGDDPGGVKWKEIQTYKYRVVFPEGCDSLAMEYAKSLEKWSDAVGKTDGLVPNQNFRRPHPVILHSHSAYSNGMVAWTPRRTELQTVPDAYGYSPQKWMDQLVVHESRHVSQVQFVNGRPYKVFTILTGQLFQGALNAIYAGPYFYEGDAVCAETEMSRAGRGRSAAFLEYYKASLQEGKDRNWWQWLYGSQNKYTPDHYAAGYVYFSGMRSVYGAQDFTWQYFKPLTHGWPFPFFEWQRTVKKISGKSNKETFREITDSLKAEWDRLDAARGELTPSSQLTADTRLFSEYRSLETDGRRLYGVRRGLDRTPELVSIEKDGSVRKIHQFASLAGHLSASNGKLYWSETIYDNRWSMRSFSDIRFLDSKGKIRSLTRHTRYFNPCAKGDSVSVTEYPVSGGSAVVILNALSGAVIHRLAAPDSLEIRESVLLGGKVYVSAASSGGIGIYKVDKGFRPVLGAHFSNLGDVHVDKDKIMFTSDLDGTQELYCLEPESGRVQRLTALKQGGQHFRFIGDTLYYAALRTGGRQLWTSSREELRAEDVDFREGYRYPVAEKLSEAAAEPHESAGIIKGPKDYSKLAHLFNLHSWIPAYVSPDAISTLSFDNLSTDLGVGATAFFQNELGTMTGSLGYAAWTKESGWRSALHAKFRYTGLYPVIELGIDFNDREAYQYLPYTRPEDGKMVTTQAYMKSGKASFATSLKAYIPWKFNSGGWQRGLIPQAILTLSNDSYSNGAEVDPVMLSASVSLRGYSMLPVASSGIYPRWGIGAEFGANGYFVPSAAVLPVYYGYLYGYVPGILRTHGIKLTALVQKQKTLGGTFTASYALPFAPVDWSFLSPVMFIRNFEFIGQASWSGDTTGGQTTLYASLAARLSNLLWVPYATRLGVYCSKTFGRDLSVGLVFSISL